MQPEKHKTPASGQCEKPINLQIIRKYPPNDKLFYFSWKALSNNNNVMRAGYFNFDSWKKT